MSEIGREERQEAAEETFHREHRVDLEDENRENPGDEDRYLLQ